MDNLTYHYLVGLALLVIGIVLNRFPPKNINNTLGYRTAFSMKSKEAWIVANKFFGLTLLVGGSLVFSFGFIGKLIYNHTKDERIAYIIIYLTTVIIFILCIILTEFYIRKIFNKDGVRKSK